MSFEWPPFLPLVAGALVLPLLPRRLRGSAFLLFPLMALLLVWRLPEGALVTVPFYGYELLLCQVDGLSRVFGLIFAFITLAGGVYAFHIEDDGQRVAASLYAAGALGVTFAGDFFSLLLFWELMAVASTFLIWARRSPDATASGMRYLLVHLFGGSLALAGIALHLQQTGSLEVRAFAVNESPAAWMILGGVAINAAIPPLHAWLADSYPRATVTGAVFMSALTTKSAVYVLVRLFPGWDVLLVLGVIMTLYGVIHAFLANDIRRILAYHIVSQVGYMVTGVGIGTELALNGTIAHAFCHILYKALLFMGTGAVIEATGRSKLTELGGLSRQLPLVLALYMVGAVSISGFPLFNGFTSKSIIITAAGDAHLYAAKFLLMLASVGTFLSVGLKLPDGTWIKSGAVPAVRKPVPGGMLVAMWILAAACLLLGVWPQPLYRWLPYAMDYQPYTLPHVIEAVQLLSFTFVAYWLVRAKLKSKPLIVLDTDWFYRRPAPWLRLALVARVNDGFDVCQRAVDRLVSWVAGVFHGSRRGLSREDGADGTGRADAYRQPLGIGLTMTLLVAVVLVLWTWWR